MFCSGGAPLPHSGPASQGSLYQQRPGDWCGRCSALVTTSPGSLLSPAPHGLSTVYTRLHRSHHTWPHLSSLLFTSNFFILREENLKTSLI